MEVCKNSSVYHSDLPIAWLSQIIVPWQWTNFCAFKCCHFDWHGFSLLLRLMVLLNPSIGFLLHPPFPASSRCSDDAIRCTFHFTVEVFATFPIAKCVDNDGWLKTKELHIISHFQFCAASTLFSNGDIYKH